MHIFIFKNQQLLKSLIIFLLFFILSPQIILAATSCSGVTCVTQGLETSATVAGIASGGPGGKADLAGMLGRIVNYMFSVLGVVALTVVLIGGYLWMTAGGNEEKVGKAKGFIINGINGLIVIFLAYALVYTILAALGGATGNNISS